MVNKVFLLGNLVRDPELVGGGKVTRFVVATNEYYKSKDGERQQRAEYHNCVAFSKLAEVVARYAGRGTKVFIEGRLETQSYESANGEKRFKTQVIVNMFQVLDGRKDNDVPQQEEPVVGNDEIDVSSIPF